MMWHDTLSGHYLFPAACCRRSTTYASVYCSVYITWVPTTKAQLVPLFSFKCDTSWCINVTVHFCIYRHMEKYFVNDTVAIFSLYQIFGLEIICRNVQHYYTSTPFPSDNSTIVCDVKAVYLSDDSIIIWMQHRLCVSSVINNAGFVNGIKHKYPLQRKWMDMYHTIYTCGIKIYPVHRELLY